MWRVLALLALLPACLEARAQDVGDDSMMRHSMKWPGALTMPDGRLREYVDVFSWDFTAARTHLPTCNAANSCEMQCSVESDGDWACVDENGSAIGVTQGTAPTFASTPWGYALTDVTDAKAPRLTSPPFGTLWSSPHTIVIVGDTSTRTGAIQFLMGNASASGGVEVRREGATLKCIWSNSGATPTDIQVSASALAAGSSGMAMWSCVKDLTGASSVYSSRSPTNTATNTTWDYDPGDATGASFYFGRRATAGLPARGPLWSVTIYSAAKTATQLETFAKQVSGCVDCEDGESGTREWVMDSNGVAWDTSLFRIDQHGIYVEENNAGAVGGAGGNWAANAIDASSWTDVGTPTVTTNTQSGPFATYNGGAEADLIEDNDGAAFEGKAATADCGDTVTGKLTVSCYVRSGTTGTTTTDMRLSIVSNGTGSTDCDFTDLTSSFVRKTCTSTIGGSPTDTRGRVLVGNAAADTGSIVVSQCQCDRQGWATSPKIDTTSVGIDTPLIDDVESVTWPSDADSGEIETVFRLDHDVPGDDSDNEDSFFLYDVPNASSTDHRVIQWYQQSTTFHQFRTTEGVSIANTATASQWTIAADTNYVARARWVTCGSGLVNHYLYFDTCADVATCEATTLVASDLTCTKVAPTGPYGPVNLGRRFNDIFGLNGHIMRLTVRELQ